MRKFLVLFFLFLFSCHSDLRVADNGVAVHLGTESYWEQSDFPIRIILDREMPVETTLSFFYAVESWNHMTERNLFSVEIHSFNEPMNELCGWVAVTQVDIHQRHNGQNAVPDTWDAYHHGTFESLSAHRCNGAIYLDQQLPANWVSLVSFHELGHALNLAHDGDQGSIMYRSVRGNNKLVGLQDSDLMQVRAMYDGVFRSRSKVWVFNTHYSLNFDDHI